MLRKFALLFLLIPLLIQADDQAFLKYRQGEQASNTDERKRAFNEALTYYLQMQTDNPSATLLYNIANTYYQLNEYGYAILYYNKALKEAPRFSEARTNLNIALQKANIQDGEPNILQSYLLFFHYKMSHNEKEITVLFLFFIAFTLLSVYLWVPQLVFKKVALILLWVSLVFVASIVWVDYFTPPQAIVVKPVALRRDAGDQYAALVGTPALSGTRVSVIEVLQNGNWLKVRTASGDVGYVSKEYVRII